MAYFLFVDESGQDQEASPCGVLAGIAIRDSTLWPFIQAVHEAEMACFGMRYSAGQRELKAKKLLKSKVFRQAAFATRFASATERRDLAKKILESGAGATARECAALALTKLQFVGRLLTLCAKFRCTLFASIVPSGAPRPGSPDFLRKDYSYLFERFFYFLHERAARGAGIIVFDELEKSRSHILIGQMDSYFKRTKKGRERSEFVVPEPFFVHSDLSTGVQIADIMAYLLSWGDYRAAGAVAPARPELVDFAKTARKLAYSGNGTRGITVIRDLRPASERK